MKKRIVLFVEGPGDQAAVPILVQRILCKLNALDSVFLDPALPYKVKGVGTLVKNEYHNWKRWLESACKKKSLGGVLLLLDGDIKRTGGTSFCAATMAKKLAKKATEVRAGEAFSVATVFACMEYESWLIAGIESLAGKPLSENRLGVPAGIVLPEGDLEAAPRDAKGWLNMAMKSSGGYKAPIDQEALTQHVDLDLIRNRPMRSFLRFESAVVELVKAIRSGKHISTPACG